VLYQTGGVTEKWRERGLTGWDEVPSPVEPVPAPHTVAGAASSPAEGQGVPAQTRCWIKAAMTK